jgi:hypothetical protein
MGPPGSISTRPRERPPTRLCSATWLLQAAALSHAQADVPCSFTRAAKRPTNARICRCERVPGTQTYAFTPRDTYNGFLIERYVDSAPRSYPFAIVNRITCHWHQICIQNAWRNCLNAAVKHDDTL